MQPAYFCEKAVNFAVYLSLVPEILTVFSGYLCLPTSYNFLAPISFSVFSLSVQLPQLFEIPFRTRFVHLTRSTPSGEHT